MSHIYFYGHLSHTPFPAKLLLVVILALVLLAILAQIYLTTKFMTVLQIPSSRSLVHKSEQNRFFYS